jgi:hypothetical protein
VMYSDCERKMGPVDTSAARIRIKSNLRVHSIIEVPYPESALRGASSSTTNISAATHFLYPRPITSSSPTVCASVECNIGIFRALFGSTTSRGVRLLVPAA